MVLGKGTTQKAYTAMTAHSPAALEIGREVLDKLRGKNNWDELDVRAVAAIIDAGIVGTVTALQDARTKLLASEYPQTRDDILSVLTKYEAPITAGEKK